MLCTQNRHRDTTKMNNKRKKCDAAYAERKRETKKIERTIWSTQEGRWWKIMQHCSRQQKGMKRNKNEINENGAHTRRAQSKQVKQNAK